MPAATETALLDCPVNLACAALHVPGRAMTVRMADVASFVIRTRSSFFELFCPYGIDGKKEKLRRTAKLYRDMAQVTPKNHQSGL